MAIWELRQMKTTVESAGGQQVGSRGAPDGQGCMPDLPSHQQARPLDADAQQVAR